MKKYYIMADLKRDPTAGESKKIQPNGQMYAGKVKAIISAETWEEAMEAGKRCITGSLRKEIVPFQWTWNEVEWAKENGEQSIYDKYKTVTWLTYYRVQAGLTQQQLADASGVNIRQIQRVELGEAEAGNLTAKNLIAIADALGINPRDLI